MKNEKSYHMTPEELEKNGKTVLKWIADYYRRMESFPVMSQVAPGEIRAGLPAHPPVEGESFSSMLQDVDKIIIPGITQGPVHHSPDR